MFNPNAVDISANPESHLLWDEVHPSAVVHQIMGRRALSTIVDSLPSGDFDGDGAVDSSDIDLLMNGIADGANAISFDLNGDGAVDDGDRDAWLVQASIKNGFAAPLLVGDSNLDGVVNASDLNTMALNWRQDVNDWTSGNFTGASVDAADLNALALNWRRSNAMASSATPAVPEPSAWLLTLLGLALVWRRQSKKGVDG